MPCSACGLSKRHLFDRAALEGGYDAVATGHNLDDEAAVLLGNVRGQWSALLQRRAPAYEAVSTWQVETTDRTPAEVVAEITALMRREHD